MTTYENATPRENALWRTIRRVPDLRINIPLAFRVPGRLRWWPLQAAVNHLVWRHEALRTVFLDDTDTSGDGAVRRAVAPADRATVDVEIIQSTADGWADDLTAFAGRLFHPDGGLLVRAALLLCPAGDAFCLVLHHAVADGRSLALLTRELVTLVEAAADGAPVPAELVGVVAATRPRPVSAESLAYWHDRLAGADAENATLTVGARPPQAPSLRATRAVHPLAPDTHAAVAALRTALRASDHVVMLAAFYVLLAHHGAGRDIIVGSPMDLRGPGQADAVGYYINTVALRQSVDPDLSFADLVRAVRRMFLDAVGHADAPLDVVLPGVPDARLTARSSLFRHQFNFMAVDPSAGALARIGADPVDVHAGTIRLDLEFFAQRGPDATVIRTLHAADVFTEHEVAALVADYEAVLTSAAAEPDRPIGDLGMAHQRAGAATAPADTRRNR